MAFFLLDWWQRRHAVPLDIRVIFYTRRGCHLCDAAAQTLADAGRRYRFSLEIIDIDSDPFLVEQYGLEIPVVTVNGRLRFRGQINPVLLERLLRAEAIRSSR